MKYNEKKNRYESEGSERILNTENIPSLTLSVLMEPTIFNSIPIDANGVVHQDAEPFPHFTRSEKKTDSTSFTPN